MNWTLKKVWSPTIEAFKRQRPDSKIKALCSLFGYSRQAYYKSLCRLEKQSFDEYLIVGLIEQKRQIWKRGSGRNLLKALQSDFKKHQIKIGRDKFYDILRRHGLLKKLRKRKVSTTDSYHRYHKYPNLVKTIQPERANEIWVSDITYIWLNQEDSFSYLFLTTEVYSRKIIGFCLSKSLAAAGALSCLNMSLSNTKDRQKGCIHHSDRGVQYCCNEYVRILKKNHFLLSMTEQSDPLENPIAERVNKTIKEEFTDDKQLSFNSLKQGKQQIKKIIRFYNENRPHRSIDWHTPNQAYNMTGVLKKHWKNYRKKVEGEFIKA